MTRSVREVLACDRCGATAERPLIVDGRVGLTGWRDVMDWPDGADVGGREPRQFCPACAERLQWFMAGGPVLDEEAPSAE